MVTTPDRRVRRTRAALREALLDLMAERGYEAVTVQDIIERADVGRSTFYNHYTDKDELLRDGFAGLRGMLTEPGPTGTRRWLRFSLPLLRHVNEQRRLVRALLGRRARTPMRQIEEVLIGIVRDEIGADTGAVPAEAVARYVVGAYVGLLEWWLTSRPRLTPEEADRLFHTLVAPGLRAATRPV